MLLTTELQKVEKEIFGYIICVLSKPTRDLMKRDGF